MRYPKPHFARGTLPPCGDVRAFYWNTVRIAMPMLSEPKLNRFGALLRWPAHALCHGCLGMLAGARGMVREGPTRVASSIGRE